MDRIPEPTLQVSSAEEDHFTDEDFAEDEPDYQEESDDELPLPPGDELDDNELPPRKRRPQVCHKDYVPLSIKLASIV
ncbi:unnamed protein product [Linum trigynum]|uniref:Uncharacterized protein n=1 Tax=Linum trigynum TaxID=586398 RepID=A0AAV2E2D5_9ROSI